jgi:MinD superfamily P-loop ATPase
MPTKKLPKIIPELCIGCAHCVMACTPGCLKIVNKKSVLVSPEKCDSEGRCICACPQKAIPHLENQKY